MMMMSTIRAYAAACAVLMTVAGCSDRSPGTITFDPNVDVFSPRPDDGSSARTFECTSRAPDGTCNVNECKQGPGGATYDCASFAAACVNAGEHWSGTKEGGKCTRVL
jgi:hypothetical protein